MLKRLRRKFIIINMSIITVMMMIIFGMVIHFMHINLQNQSVQMMLSIANDAGAPLPPGDPGNEVRFPYFTIMIEDTGEVLSTGHDYFDLSDESYLIRLVDLVESTGQESGVLKEYQLRFLKAEARPGVEHYIFSDASSERDTMLSLVQSCFFISILAFLGFLTLSIFLSRWAIRPVEEAWTQQIRFVADASHELKTPLTVITTNAELLQSTEYGEEEKTHFSAAILTMSRQMRGLVEGLLDLARVDSGVVHASMETFSLSELVEETMLPFEALFFEKSLTLVGEVDEGIYIKGSQSHLRQVMDILLDNAQKYSYSDSEVKVSLSRSGRSNCTLAVSNCGEPISKEDLEHIFKRFYRVDRVRTMNRSYGLGLSIAEQIFLNHNGTSRAESENGVNTFFVQLPAI